MEKPLHVSIQKFLALRLILYLVSTPNVINSVPKPWYERMYENITENISMEALFARMYPQDMGDTYYILFNFHFLQYFPHTLQ